jgi:hypothetical protein
LVAELEGVRVVRESRPGISAVSGLVVPLELETQAQVFLEQSGSGLDRGYTPLTFERAGRFRVRRRDRQDGRDEVRSLGLAAIVPAWLTSPRVESSAKSANRADAYPPALARAELRGMAAGPSAYLRARRVSPPWRR